MQRYGRRPVQHGAVRCRAAGTPGGTFRACSGWLQPEQWWGCQPGKNLPHEQHADVPALRRPVLLTAIDAPEESEVVSSVDVVGVGACTQ